MASIRWQLLLVSVLCLLSDGRTQVNVNEIKLPDTNGKSAISSSSTTKTTQSVTKSVSVSTGKAAAAQAKVQVRVQLVCPSNDTAVPLFTLPCERDSDCKLLGAGLMCCARKDVRFKRCLKGLPAPKPEPPHAPWLRVFPRKCPESPLAEFREVKNCSTDTDCTPRICCPERGTSDSYCRTATIQFDGYPTVKRMLEHNDEIKKHTIPRIPKTIHFSAEEEKILILWKNLDVLNSCLNQSKGKLNFSFYDGPPFATGLPHFGHILTGTIKDIVARYAHQQGFHVERRFGWDCHGLPVEYEIDKIFNIKCPDDVMKMGIKNYNNECRKIVSQYVNKWEQMIWRIGRWMDFKNDYKTMYPWYMESVWWVFKELFSKGLVYKGVKVMPFSTACNTPISNFESNQNYKDIVDPAIIVSFSIIEDLEKTSLLIWTTTPWSLPSNLALCVNSKLTYVKVREIKSGNIYILLKDRLNYVFNEVSDYAILHDLLGSDLENLRYNPLFPYFTSQFEKGAFKVVCDDFVSADSGTGIVHLAPYFGEHDYRVCLAAGIINTDTDQEPICPVDVNGRFTDPVIDFRGEYVKDADKKIINFLKNEGKILKIGNVKHSYPFCWRSDTPLIYKAVPSWFIRVKDMVNKLQKNTCETYWVPDFVREKRFRNWLREAHDWAVSRNRYWGTPIPLWISPDGEEVVCVGSIKELETLTNTKVLDLHREHIDHLEIPSKKPGKPNLRRITEVFDCWFESGAMPFAQQHYPFENLEKFNNCFPADFIAEGIDQTRGWFYTLIVLSTALFDKPPFKNVIVNGLVLASDGQKMSKSKKNFNKTIIDETVERSVSRMQSVIELARVIRDKRIIPIKYPLPEIIVIHHDQQYIEDVLSLENYILSELNIKKLIVSKDMKKYNVTLKASPNNKILGVKLKNKLKEVSIGIKKLTEDEIKEIVSQGWKEIAGQRIELSEIRLNYEYTDDNKINTKENRYEMQNDNNVLILLNVTPNASMLDDGTAREIINRIQKLRNKAGLVPTDSIVVYYLAKGDIEKVIDSHKNIIESNIKALFLPLDDIQPPDVLADDILKIKDSYIHLLLIKTKFV